MEENKPTDVGPRFVRGLPIPPIPLFKPRIIEEAMDYRPLDGDTLIVSFPKTGTNLTLYTVVQILTKGESSAGLKELHDEKTPFMEVAMEAIRNLAPPRLYTTHIPYEFQTKNENAKYIYVYRNPADTIVSMYHFFNTMASEPIVLDELFESFVKGENAYGNFFDHVLAYYRHRNEPNILLVSYEKFVANKEEVISRIAEFLGDEYFQSVKNPAVIRKILDNTKFDHMKKNLRVAIESDKGEVEINFFRKGIVGDGKNTLSEAQLQRLKELTMQRMEGTDILDEWLKVF